MAQRKAKTLRELLMIRDANKDYIDSIKGNLGSVLGLKNGHGDPCITIFVPRKINAKWLPAATAIKDTLTHPNGLYCVTDVVEGGKYDRDLDVNVVDVSMGSNPFGLLPVVSRKDFLGPPPIASGASLELLAQLHGETEKITPGSRLYHPDGWIGTLGCFVKKPSGTKGILTNEHVAGAINSTLQFPSDKGVPVGTVRDAVEYITDEARFPGIVDEPDSKYRVDCAFVELAGNLGTDEIDPRYPVLTKSGTIERRELGDPLPLDLDTLGPLGEKVISVGQRRSFQRGMIAGFAYSYDVFDFTFAPDPKEFTDYLIVSDDEDGQFSDRGDSGKIIITDDGNFRPVALLWGGWQERLSRGRMQEDWTYAIDINKVLSLLDVSILKKL